MKCIEKSFAFIHLCSKIDCYEGTSNNYILYVFYVSGGGVIYCSVFFVKVENRKYNSPSYIFVSNELGGYFMEGESPIIEEIECRHFENDKVYRQ